MKNCWALFWWGFLYPVLCFCSLVSNATKNLKSEGVGGFVVIAGGWNKNGHAIKSVSLLNTYTREWSSLADLPDATEGSQLFYADGMLLIAGGKNAFTLFQMYISSVRFWKSLPDLNPSVGWGVCGAILDGSTYIIGGSAPKMGDPISGTQVMNMSSFPTWGPGAKLQQARMLCGAASLGNNVYTCGSWSTGADGKTCEKYDPVSNSWSFIASMNDYRIGQTLVAVGGYLYAVGGNNLGTAERYDPATNAWTYIQPVINSARTTSAAVTDGKHIYLMGGCGKIGRCDPAGTQTNAAEVYIPELNQWEVLPSMPEALEDVAIAYLPQLPN